MTPCAMIRFLVGLPGWLRGWAFERYMAKLAVDMAEMWPALPEVELTTPE